MSLELTLFALFRIICSMVAGVKSGFLEGSSKSGFSTFPVHFSPGTNGGGPVSGRPDFSPRSDLSFKFNLSTFLILFLEAKLLFHSLGLQLSGRLLAFLHQLDVAGVLGADSGQISDLFGLGDAVNQLL